MGTLDLLNAVVTPPKITLRGVEIELRTPTAAESRQVDAAIPRPLPPKIIDAGTADGARAVSAATEDPLYKFELERWRADNAHLEAAFALRWETAKGQTFNTSMAAAAPLTPTAALREWAKDATAEIAGRLYDAEITAVLMELRAFEKRIHDAGKVSSSSGQPPT